MKYGIIGRATYRRHYGIIKFNRDGYIKLEMLNKRFSSELARRNREMFNEIVKVINKYYDLEDLNIKHKYGSKSIYKNNRIKKGEFDGVR